MPDEARVATTSEAMRQAADRRNGELSDALQRIRALCSADLKAARPLSAEAILAICDAVLPPRHVPERSR